MLPLWRVTAVVTLVVGSLVGTAVGSASTTPASVGMSGLVQVAAAAFPSPEHAVLLISQCRPCGNQGGPLHSWLALSADGGQHWRVVTSPVPAEPGAFVFADAEDGWAADTTGAGKVWVTHDGGTTWRPVPLPAADAAVWSLTIAGGEVWALGQGEDALGPEVVLRGPASGNTLTPVPSTAKSLATIVAGSATDGYVISLTTRQPSVGTDDAGASWYDLAPACTSLRYGLPLGRPGAHGTDLLQPCEATRMLRGRPVLTYRRPFSVLERSTDGGRTWAVQAGGLDVSDPVFASSAVVWGVCKVVDVCRSTDGGRSWNLEWRSPATWVMTTLTTRGASAAYALGTLTTHRGGTDIVYAATTDAGAHWHQEIVPLPDR